MATLANLPSGVTTEALLDFELSDGATRGTMRFAVPAMDLGPFLEAVAGINETITYPGGVTATRRIPLIHPMFPGCYAVGIRGGLRPNVCTTESPRGAPGSPTDHTSIAVADPSDRVSAYVCDVQFVTPPYNIGGGEGDYPLVTRQLRTGVEFQPRPGTAYKFSDNSYPKRDVPVQIPTAEFSLTFHKVPSLNETLYLGLTGKVNSSMFYGIAPGSCLYMGAQTSGQRTQWGVTTYEVTHTFKYRAIIWNTYMRADGAWDILENRATGEMSYLPANLNAIWG